MIDYKAGRAVFFLLVHERGKKEINQYNFCDFLLYFVCLNNQNHSRMATPISAQEASKFYSIYHGGAGPILKNSNGSPIEGFIIEDADYQALKAKAGKGFAGIMAVPARNDKGDDTIILVGLTLSGGNYSIVMPPNSTDKTFIFDFVVPVPPGPANTNFSDLNLPNWGC